MSNLIVIITSSLSLFDNCYKFISLSSSSFVLSILVSMRTLYNSHKIIRAQLIIPISLQAIREALIKRPRNDACFLSHLVLFYTPAHI